MAGKIIGEKQVPLADLYTGAVKRKTSVIVADTSHPLYS